MICPNCANETTRVIKTEKSLKNTRWRKCPKCKYGWLTEEKPVKDEKIIEYVNYIDELEDEEQ